MTKLIKYLHSKSRSTKAMLVIHAMAIAHSLVALAALRWGFKDSIALTALTIAMIFILCNAYRLPLYTTAIIALVSSFMGEFVGTFASLKLTPLLAYANIPLTFVITQIIGWATYLAAINNSPESQDMPKMEFGERIKDSDLKFLYINSGIIALVMLLLRVGYMEYYIHLKLQYNFTITTVTHKILNNNIALIALLLTIIIAIMSPRTALFGKKKKQSARGGEKILKILYFLLQFIIPSIIVSLLLFISEISSKGFAHLKGEILFCFIIISFFNIFVFGIAHLVYYIRSSRVNLRKATRNKIEAEYKYIRFKKQLDPHFLFNSLNMLDNMVYEQNPEVASQYIRKLAGIYRYILLCEDKIEIALEDELHFAKKYISLLEVRFGSALHTQIEIPSELHGAKVVTCSLQLLIENAVKHNVVSKASPLMIEIFSDGDTLIVRNNIQPKLSLNHQSTKFGLQSLREQFSSLSKREVVIIESPSHFTVKLPLIF